MHALKECQSCARDWEQRLEEGLKLWRHVQEKAKPLDNWISAAEHALNPSAADSSLIELSVCAVFSLLVEIFFRNYYGKKAVKRMQCSSVVYFCLH